MRGIKQMLDPKGLMNPGKILLPAVLLPNVYSLDAPASSG